MKKNQLKFFKNRLVRFYKDKTQKNMKKPNQTGKKNEPKPSQIEITEPKPIQTEKIKSNWFETVSVFLKKFLFGYFF